MALTARGVKGFGKVTGLAGGPVPPRFKNTRMSLMRAERRVSHHTAFVTRRNGRWGITSGDGEER